MAMGHEVGMAMIAAVEATATIEQEGIVAAEVEAGLVTAREASQAATVNR